MSFLAPAAFWCALLILPLLWLWRFTQSRRTIVIPSLAPFKHLREQLPKSQWVRIHPLLLLQLLLLAALTLSLAKPRLHGKWFDRPRRTTIAILDNSASMRAEALGVSAFTRARAEVLRIAGDLGAHDRLLVVSTAPPQLATPQWVSEVSSARTAVYQIQPTDAPGDVAGAIQLAQSLVGERGINRLFVATDAPKPAGDLPAYVEWHQSGKTLANVALTRFDLSHALTEGLPLSATVDVVNFADVSQTVEVAVLSAMAPVAEQRVTLSAGERRSVVLGPFTLAVADALSATIKAPHDALRADNTRRIIRHGAQVARLRLEGLSPSLETVFDRLIRGTPSLARAGAVVDVSADPAVRIIQLAPGDLPAAPTLYCWPIARPRDAQPVRIVDWDPAHPVTRFLTNVDQIPVTTVRDAAWPAWARPVLWGSDGSRSMPLLGVGQRAGFREVVTTLDLDRVNFEDPRAVELLIVLLNITQWLAPANQTLEVATGAPLAVPFVPAGALTITPPTGGAVTVEHAGGPWEYAETWWAGSYRVSGPTGRWQFHAALQDERESNLLALPSGMPEGIWPKVAVAASAETAPRPMDRWLLWLAAAVFLIEWWYYQRRVVARSAAG